MEDLSYTACKLCPRGCGVNRSEGGLGVCGVSSQVRIARAALHFWEEPPISGDAGSGTIFFSGCPLRCVYCQNTQISHEGFGREVSQKRLVEIMLELQDAGALNINLVTALHFAPSVREAVLAAKKRGLTLPIVCNTGGYELASVVDAMADVVDIWLTDFKYADARLGAELSGVKDYPERATEALRTMKVQVDSAGGRLFADDGRMLRGLIVRHLVLPGHTDDSCAVLERIAEICTTDVDVSVMNQYTPNAAMRRAGGNLASALSEQEYECVLNHADDLGFEHLWWQEGGTVSESFVPAFDLTGVTGEDATT